MYLIGIDGGGSKTKAIAINELGEIVACAEVGSSNLNSTSMNEVEANMKELAAKLNAQNSNLQLSTKFIYGGFAGAYQPQNAKQLKQWLELEYPQAQVQVVEDSLIALYAGTFGKPGIVQIIGTGSGTYGFNEKGESVRAGGWGYLIDDFGSGYDLGKMAMSAIFQAFDNRAPQTSLTARVLTHFQVEQVPDLISSIYSGNAKSALAPLSRYVSEEAQKGDEVSFEIIGKAAKSVALSLNSVAARFTNQTIAVVKIGSVWNAHNMQQLIEQRLQFNVQWVQPACGAEMGGVFAIIEQQQLAISFDTILQNYRNWLRR